MDQNNVTKKIADYIQKNHISVEQASRDTGIELAKLDGTSREKLSASEFLEICAYLNIRPEEMR